MHRCKEWAWDNGYTLKTHKDKNSLYVLEIFEKTRTEQDHTHMIGDSEPDVIFRACFWLMAKKRVKI